MVKGAVRYLRDIQHSMKDVRKFEDLLKDFLASRKAGLPKEVVNEISDLATRTGNDLEAWRARIDTIIEMLQQEAGEEPLDDDAKPDFGCPPGTVFHSPGWPQGKPLGPQCRPPMTGGEIIYADKPARRWMPV
jgi:hypothetical protein